MVIDVEMLKFFGWALAGVAGLVVAYFVDRYGSPPPLS